MKTWLKMNWTKSYRIFSLFGLLIGSSTINAQQNSATFNYTGQPQTWTVPSCVFEACFTVRGARGGGQGTTNTQAGNGATVNACIDVTPGEVLTIHVGGAGTNGSASGGWNGGGTGHNATNANPNHHSKGGGGASDVRQGGTGLANRVIVAAGGGGKGGGSTPTVNIGGAGGCATGSNGGNTFGQGGGGASQTAGGNGGNPWAGTPPGGQAGSLGQGGNGGLWQTASGGGGGGGRYGGGGGGNDGCCTNANGGGGGGGGSSLTPVGGTCTPGNHSAAGQVTITWTGGGSGSGGVIGPPMQISDTGPYCAGEDIELSASNATADFFIWWGPNGFTSNVQNPTIPGANVNASYTGTYYMHYMENGCEDTLELQVTVYDPATPNFVQYQDYCQDATIPALPTTSTNISNYTQTEVTGSWTPAINNQQTTTYTFVPDPGQCALATTMQIEIIPNIVPQFTQIGPFCIGTPIDPLPETSLDNITGLWSPAINNQDTTIYTFTPNPGECAYPTTMQIAIWPLVTPQFNQVAAICQDDALPPLPTNSLPTVLGPISGSWSPAMNNQVTTMYTFTPFPGQCALENTMSITVFPRPLPTFAQDDTLGCAPFQVFFENTTGFSNPLSCQWTMGNSDVITSCASFVSSTYTAPGCYDVTLTMTYPGNCVNSYTAIDAVCVGPDPVSSFTANPTEVEINQPIEFTNFSTGASNYEWTFGDFTGTFTDVSPTHSYEAPGFYQIYLVAISDIGCTDTSAQAVLVEEPLIYYIPNTFTPDADPFNPTFMPIMTQGFDILGYQLLIFNRWGEVMFESNDAEYGWDGTYGGEVCDDGVYIWKIRYKVIGADRPQEMSGHVNLIR